MKLLLETTDGALLLEKAALLQSRGIPVHVDNIPHVGAVPSHLYVMFDRHFDDAACLLEDAEHVVASPVFEEELRCIAEQVREVKLSLGNRLLDRVLIAVLLLMGVSYVGARVFG